VDKRFVPPGNQNCEVSTLTLQEEKKWRDLCQQALCEKDVDKLLKLFLALDRTAEREQRRLAKPLGRATVSPTSCTP